jgi:hypothetical protein
MPLNGVIDCLRQSSGICKFLGGGLSFPCKIDFAIPSNPWTNGQVERMNRTLKEATVQRYHYGTHAQLKAHLHTFLMAYNFAKRLILRPSGA